MAKPPKKYEVRKHDDTVRCCMVDYLDEQAPGFRQRYLPYSVWGPAGSFAFGQVMAFCPDQETADDIAKALTLLDRVKRTI